MKKNWRRELFSALFSSIYLSGGFISETSLKASKLSGMGMCCLYW